MKIKKEKRNAVCGIMLGLFLLAVVTPTVNAQTFVDLGDIVGGGDGSGTGVYNTGIDPRTGGLVGTTWAGCCSPGTTLFDAVPSNPLVDGVFVPRDTASGTSTPISTTGLSFMFPDTNGASWDAIRNGVSTMENNQDINPIYDENGIVITVGVGIHANAGITFDLDAVRALYPGIAITSFTGNVGGIPSPTRCGSGSAIAHVLVNGASVFSERVWNTAALSTVFTIPIIPSDSFLTLASTDIGSFGCDKVYFGNALLQMTETETDTDGDSIPDNADNCPAVANPFQENNDGDALGDVCDADDDNDGTDDVDDNCPIDGNPDQADFDFDGLGDACDATIDAGSIAQHIEDEVAGIVQTISAINVSGGNGMIKKLTGNGGVIKKMSSAITAFVGGYIDLETYLSELDGALSMLDAFDNQIAAKIANGKIVDPDAAAIVAASTEIRTTIGNLKVSAGG